VFKFFLAAAAAIALATSAFGASVTSANADAHVRVVHASPDAPAVDVYANGARVLSNVPFKGASDYLTVPAGTYTFEVRPAGAPATSNPVLSATTDLQGGMAYTVMAVDRLSQIKARVFVDTNAAPAAGKAHVQVVHASPNAPTVDIALRGGPVLVPELPFGELKGPLPVDAGTYNLEIRVAGTNNVALPLSGVSLEAGKVYTFVAVGLVGGDPALSVLPLSYTPPAAGHLAPPRAGDAGLAGEGASGSSPLAWMALATALVLSTLAAARFVTARTRR
jgi:hypothetical protein